MKTILIIEDDLVLRDNISDFLEEEGYRILKTENGIDGIKLAIEQIPDLILCDIEIPNIKGYDVFRILQENSATTLIPFVFITARVSKDDIRAGMQLGADDYITKPFDIEELLTTIEIRIKKRERLIDAGNECYRMLFDNSLSGAFLIQSKRIVYSNIQLSKTLGYTSNALEEVQLTRLIYHEDIKAVKKKVRACIRGIQQIINLNFRIVTKNGKPVMVRMCAGITIYKGRKTLIGNILKLNGNKNHDELCIANRASLEYAIRVIEQNQHIITPTMVKKLSSIYHSDTPTQQNTEHQVAITQREKEVLQLICEGLSTQDIARRLSVSARTVDTHRSNLIRKTGTRNVVDLVLFGIKHQVVAI